MVINKNIGEDFNVEGHHSDDEIQSPKKNKSLKMDTDNYYDK